jgi:anti-sigma-K factor RskA
MALDENHDGLAAEFALGTLSAAERAEAQALMLRDPAFAKTVRDWEASLTPLSEAIPERRPPDDMWQRIRSRIADAGAGGTIIALKRQLSLWRGASVGLAALAAAMGAFLLLSPQQAGLDGRYVAVLQSEGPGPAFVAAVDLSAGTISVRRVGAEPQAGKSYEVWAVGGGRDKPQSLGVIDASLKIPQSRFGTLAPDTVLAISLEPEGGSPTGQPTGPVLYTGTLVATE